MPVKYFAYGSNMAADAMARECPRHRFLGPARLAGHRLAFTRRSIRTGTGVADVVPADGACVWGALYELDERELEALDRKEGQDWAYTRRALTVQLADGPEHRAFAYTVIEKEPVEVRPSREYLEGLIRAARARGLPDGHIELLESLRAWPPRGARG